MKSRQPGLFDVEEGAAQLSKMGDPLVGLNVIFGKQKPEKTHTRLLIIALSALVRNILKRWIASTKIKSLY
jgi:hypothetical protein